MIKITQHCLRCGTDKMIDGKEGYCRACVAMINRKFEEHRRKMLRSLRVEI